MILFKKAFFKLPIVKVFHMTNLQVPEYQHILIARQIVGVLSGSKLI